MEHNVEGMAKKIWNIVRVAFYMLRKGICKRKILLDLNIMMKRGKLAGKSIRNLMFHHHHHHSSATDLHYAASAASNPDEYEFSCSSTPIHRRYFNKKKSHHPDVEAVNKVLEMIMMSPNNSMAASPILPALEFGRSPMVRQLRVTDSPFPLEDNPDGDIRVDQAAEDFINKFYSQLKQQKYY